MRGRATLFATLFSGRNPLQGLDVRSEVVRVDVGVDAVAEVGDPAPPAEGLALLLGVDGQLVLEEDICCERRARPRKKPREGNMAGNSKIRAHVHYFRYVLEMWPPLHILSTRWL